MNLLVSLQVVGLAEGLPAHAALKRLLSGVDSLVADEVLRDAETLPAVLADVRLLAGVRALVQVEAGPRGEHFLALSAGERRSLRVSASVHLQVVPSAVAPPTDVTGKGFGASVQLHVRLQDLSRDETLAALVTRVRFVRAVRKLVAFQRGGRGEVLVAL